MLYAVIELGLLPYGTKQLPDANFDFSLKMFCSIHLREISQAELKILIHKMRLKNTLLKLQPDLPETNELNQRKDDAQMWWFLCW